MVQIEPTIKYEADRVQGFAKVINERRNPTMLEVRFVSVPPMRAARFRGERPSPETQVRTRLRAWAEPRGLLQDTAAHPVFGFNGPGPSRPGEEYGYEFWIRVGPAKPIEGDVETVDFPGGLYAVTIHHVLPNHSQESFKGSI